MTNTSKTLVFFGNERLSTGFQPHGAPTLQALINEGYHIAAVVSHYTPGISRKARQLEVEEVAKAHNIPVLLPPRIKDIEEQLRSYNAVAGILVAYGRIIPQEIIDIFPQGIINIHPSLLPRHRGSTPVEQTILDGDKQAGVSIMSLVKTMDAGPIYAQSQLLLDGTETKQHLTTKLLHIGSTLLIEKLPAILDASLSPTPQDGAKATYTRLLSKQDGVVDTTKTAQQIEREIRAYATWPKSSATLFGHAVIITKAKVVKAPSDRPILTCTENSYLEIT